MVTLTPVFPVAMLPPMAAEEVTRVVLLVASVVSLVLVTESEPSTI